MIRIPKSIGKFWPYTGSAGIETGRTEKEQSAIFFKIISKWPLFLQKKRKPVPFEHFCGWKQSLLGVCNHETYRLTGSRSVFGWGWGGAGAFPPLLSSTSQSHLRGLAPLYQPPESDGNPFTGCLTSSNPVSQTSSPLKPTQWQALSLLPVDILTVLIKQISILW